VSTAKVTPTEAKAAKRLLAAYRKKLKESGLTEKDAKRLGFELLDAAEVDARQPNYQRRGGILMPYFDPTGTNRKKMEQIRYLDPPSGFHAQVKKPRRYHQPTGGTPEVYFPIGLDCDWPTLLRDPTQPLIITEGELKAACATKFGFPTIGLGGVDSFRASKIGKLLIDDLEAIAWKGRKVFIAYDSDLQTNCDVRRALRVLARELYARGGDVREVKLPGGPDGTKVGLDDYLVKHKCDKNKEPFVQLLAAAVEAELEHPTTDAGNADRIVERFGDDIRHVEGLGWLAWDGRRWAQRNAFATVKGCAIKSARAILEEAGRAGGAGDDTRCKDLKSWAHTSQAGPRLREAIALVQVDEKIIANIDEFDTNPWLLNVANGTINLRTRKLQPHRREDLITKLAPVVFNAKAPRVRFEKFMKEIIPTREMREFVKRAVGYSLTGLTDEQVLFLLLGIGENGKTTFVELIMKGLLGPDYAKKASSELLLAQKYSKVSNDVARLRGARFVVSAETDQGRELAEAKVKELTGGDTLTARFLFKEEFEFTPVAKLWLYTNHRPVIKGTDDAIWRRIRVIPFNMKFPPEKRDGKLDETLHEELSGILNWALEGCIDWQREKLNPPEAVLRETEEYREEQDTLGGFIDEYCIEKPGVCVSCQKLYAAYQGWAKDREGRRNVLTQQQFGEAMKARGRERKRKGEDRRWHRIGIALRPDKDVEELPKGAAY